MSWVLLINHFFRNFNHSFTFTAFSISFFQWMRFKLVSHSWISGSEYIPHILLWRQIFCVFYVFRKVIYDFWIISFNPFVHNFWSEFVKLRNNNRFNILNFICLQQLDLNYFFLSWKYIFEKPDWSLPFVW